MNLNYPPGATPIDPDEMAGLIPDITTQSQLNEFEALNIAEAILWALRSRKTKRDLLSEQTLREIHRRMFGKTWKWAGLFRITQKSIGVESYRISSEIRRLADAVAAWRQWNSYPSDEVLARFHHRLVWIHPFPNGNGRHARFATDLLSELLSVPRLTWSSGDLIRSGETRRRYIEALQRADVHDFLPLIAYIRS